MEVMLFVVSVIEYFKCCVRQLSVMSITDMSCVLRCRKHCIVVKAGDHCIDFKMGSWIDTTTLRNGCWCCDYVTK